LDGVREVRVLGAIGVVQLERAPSRLDALRRRFVEHGVWIRPFGDVVYLMPPLVIESGDLAELLTAIPRVLTETWAADEL
jgi:adenosylmethionine-8-amino-7-oxononanoate aminotransferase